MGVLKYGGLRSGQLRLTVSIKSEDDVPQIGDFSHEFVTDFLNAFGDSDDKEEFEGFALKCHHRMIWNGYSIPSQLIQLLFTIYPSQDLQYT